MWDAAVFRFGSRYSRVVSFVVISLIVVAAAEDEQREVVEQDKY